MLITVRLFIPIDRDFQLLTMIVISDGSDDGRNLRTRCGNPEGTFLPHRRLLKTSANYPTGHFGRRSPPTHERLTLRPDCLRVD